MTRAVLFAFGWVLLLLGYAAGATAAPIELRSHLCIVPGIGESTPVSSGGLKECPRPPAASASATQGWTWLQLAGPSALNDLPAGWQLLIDQTRFRRIAVVATAADGSRQTIDLRADELSGHWAPGGLLRFTIDRPGREIVALSIGFDRLDALSLMRKVTAVSAREAEALRDRWYILFGLFCGALVCAFSYNLVIYTGQRYPFQRWYLLWAGTALLYGLLWTNMGALLWPALVGPISVRADVVLVGLLIAAGDMFFLSVLEPGMLPARLRPIIRGWAIASVVAGIAAALDGVFPAELTDALLNDVFAAGTLSVLIGVCFALRRGSRVILFYLAGWTPVLSVLGLRLLRNFGLLGQNDIVDMATFGTLAFEAVVLSLAIADRFRLLRQERDAAEQARAVGEAEAVGYRRAALTDFLTGLGNRAAFQAAMQQQVCARDPRGFTLVLIDVDHLKDVNDRLGHGGGDALLCFVASALSQAAGAAATLHRIGGDEFAVILPGASTGEIDRLFADLEALQGRDWQHLGHHGTLSLSLGSAHFPGDADDSDLFGSADLALYEAKREGRRRHRRYDPTLRERIASKAALLRDALQGLREDRFCLYFQPVVDISNGRCVGHEALLRWDHPVRGLLAPDDFTDALLDDEIGNLIQARVLEGALDHLAADRNPSSFLCVNFTGVQLDGALAAEHLVDRLRSHGIAPGKLCVEVTEGTVLKRSNAAIAAALQTLHEAGVRIALDDFGTGYASLVHLQQIPADTLKIDRSFIAGLGAERGAAEQIIRAILSLGEGLGKTVIAEGIETADQRARLVQLGCRYGQGYYFGKPAPQRHRRNHPARPARAAA